MGFTTRGGLPSTSQGKIPLSKLDAILNGCRTSESMTDDKTEDNDFESVVRETTNETSIEDSE